MDVKPSSEAGAEGGPDCVEVRSYFVRGRNALLTRAQFGGLYLEYYLHQGQHGYQHAPEDDGRLKEALAALTLHMASRPWNETWAWTIHLHEPLMNLFVTGDNRLGRVVGQLFTENVRADGCSLFLADMVRERGEPRRSSVEIQPVDSFRIVEQYYQRSEQRPARFFEVGPEDYVMVSAQPDCDMEWFDGLDDAAVGLIDQNETLSLLETRVYQWQCGCSHERLLGVLAPMMQKDPAALFEGDAAVRVGCPRCGARHVITREALEAFVAAGAGGSSGKAG